MVSNIRIDVSDAIGASSDAIRDISRSGLCLHDLAVNVGWKSASYKVVVTHEDLLFKLRRRPRWEAAGPVYKKMGVQNAAAPGRWTDYVSTLEPVGRRRG